MRSSSTYHKQTILVTIIATLIFLCEFFSFPWLNLTKSQNITVCILLIAAFMWVTEFIPLFVVSFVILALEIVWLLPLLVLEDRTLTSNIFFSPFFSNIILLFLGGFVLSALMQKYGLDVKFAHVILEKTKGRPNITLLGIIVSSAFLSMWISNTATAAMMLTIIYPLLNRIPQHNKFKVALVLSIPFACNIGGIGTPIGTPPNAIALSYLAEKGLALSFLQWIGLTFPLLVVFVFILWRVLIFLYPAKTLVLEIEDHVHIPMTVKHWTVIGIFVLTVLGWFFGASLGLSTGTIALFPIIISFWFGLLDTSDFRKLPWDILYIISGGLALGIALKLSMLDSVVMNQLPLDMPPVLLFIMIAFFVGIMSTLMSNTATAGLTIPLVTSLQIGQEYMLIILLVLTLMCSMAMALPVTTPPNAIAFSSRVIRSKDMIISGGLISVIGFVIVSTLGPWYWRMVVPIFVGL